MGYYKRIGNLKPMKRIFSYYFYNMLKTTVNK